VKPRFLGDVNFNKGIVTGVVRRLPLVDFEVADNLDLRGQDDYKVLQIAAEASRIMVTHDCRTMPTHFAEFLEGHSSPGVILVPQNISIGTAVEKLIYVWEEFDHESWTNQIAYLNQIRKP
jgi:hypothetical protein